jgi:hypothetical protein
MTSVDEKIKHHEYYLKNKEKIIDYNTKRYQANKEQYAKYNHEYYMKHREYLLNKFKRNKKIIITNEKIIKKFQPMISKIMNPELDQPEPQPMKNQPEPQPMKKIKHGRNVSFSQQKIQKNKYVSIPLFVDEIIVKFD